MSAVYRVDTGLALLPGELRVDEIRVYPQHIALVREHGGEWHFHLGSLHALTLIEGEPVKLRRMGART